MSRIRKQRKTRLPRVYREDKRWTNRELLLLAVGLQNFGAEETDKISAIIKTKDANAVKAYVTQRVRKIRLKWCHEGKKNVSLLNATSVDEVKDWPNVRKWQKIAQNQMMLCHRRHDYSRILMQKLCQKFYDEAEEIDCPQIIDLKAIYKFILDCVSGNVPAELPPKESAVVLMLLKKLQGARDTMDLKEELDFIKSFKKAASFVPFKVKDEFKKKEHKEPMIDIPGAVPIPEEMYTILSRHRKLVQCFNPLMVPIWLFDKEQEELSRNNDPSGQQSTSMTRPD